MGQANYTASSGYVVMSKSLAIEYAKEYKYKLHITRFINTAMTDKIDKSLKKP